MANDGIVHQKAVMAYAQGSYPMIQLPRPLGVKFQKDGSGDYDVRKVHHMGTYVLPMPEGHHVKKILYRQLRRLQVGRHQPVHGDAPAQGGRTGASPARSASTPAPASSWWCAPRR